MKAHLARGIRLLAILAVVLIPCSSFVQAGGHGHGGGGGGGSGFGGSNHSNSSMQSFAKPISGNGMNQNVTRSIQNNNFNIQTNGSNSFQNAVQNSQRNLPALKNISNTKISGLPQHQNNGPAGSNVLSQKIGDIQLGNQNGNKPGSGIQSGNILGQKLGSNPIGNHVQNNVQNNVQKHVGGIQDKITSGIKSLPNHNQNSGINGHNVSSVLGQGKHFKMPDQWFGSGKGPIKIQSQNYTNQHHCFPQHKDCHGNQYKHFCHYNQCFNAWWYQGPSYCNVIVVPAQPIGVQVTGVAAQPAGPAQIILIANLPENAAEVAYLVNGSVVRTAPGSAEPISAPTAEITYDRGGGLGVANASLDAGTYEFHRTAEGWQLLRKTFRIAIENRGALDVFRFQADGKAVELPAGTQMQFETNFPMTITFEQNGQPASRQVADGLFMVGPAESGLLDILAVTE